MISLELNLHKNVTTPKNVPFFSLVPFSLEVPYFQSLQ